MEDILYRAYHKLFNKYLAVRNIDFSSRSVMLLYNGTTYIDVSFDDIVLEMYFGKNDKNGVAIFEGDIVVVPFGFSGDYSIEEHYSIIEWNETGFIFDGPDDCDWNDLRVVGNKNENINIIYEAEAMEMLDREYKGSGRKM